MKEDSVVHVRLETPVHIRREILESAIETAEILKSMDRVMQFQQQKLRYWERLRTSINKIRTTNNQLFTSMPQISLPKPKKSPEIKILKPSELIKPKPQKEKKENPLSKELDDIRRKLENLKI
ncbi:hypothetical protein HYT58_00280 [Candidatus Woesearchaeota archaeon]|nr:hypothetical protein [Candidatus Woesearchaeota archaeon]